MSRGRGLLNSGPEIWLHCGLAVAACLLVSRLVYLQGFHSETLSHRASRQQLSEETLFARPGDLLDRQGRILATTISVPSLYVNPRHVDRDEIDSLAGKLADCLSLDAHELADRIRRHADRQFLWVRRRLSDDEAARVRQLALPARVAGFRREFQRCYPQGRLAAHLIGLRDIDGIGRGGAEEAFDALLRGSHGVRRFVRDARGYMLDVREEVTTPPEHGRSIRLTVDLVLQSRVEFQLDALIEKHQPAGVCAIVLDPHTGEILALASRPTFDPRSPGESAAENWKNLAISAVFEPGSTIKPLIVAWALDRQLLRSDEEFDCENGVYRMGRRLLHDHHRYGTLSVTEILAKSSNIGMAKIGERLGNAELFQLVRRFGFGQKTGIEIPGELPGILRTLDDWNSYSTGSIPMGHELAATPLQLIAAHAVLANGGSRITPHLLLDSPDESLPKQVLVSPVIGREAASWVVTGPMREVITKGTGKLAQLPDTTVFGKTGTAQKLNLDGQGYARNRHVSSFVCGAPAENPQRLVIVCVDDPRSPDQYGGTVAAPFAAAILQDSLQRIDLEE